MAIRTCSRRTCCWMAAQSVAFQFPGRSKDASVPGGTVICFSFFTIALLVFLPGETRPTWAYPMHYTPALAFSVVPVLRPLTRLAVRPARLRTGRGCQRFHVLLVSQDELGSLCTPAMRGSRWVNREDPSLIAHLLVRALTSLLWLVIYHDACERLFGFNRVIRF